MTKQQIVLKGKQRMEAIKTSSLTKNYGKSRGITELNLSVKEGEFFGFIGPNGAGKSTTIRTLTGLISPTSGSAKVLGHGGFLTVAERKLIHPAGYIQLQAFTEFFCRFTAIHFAHTGRKSQNIFYFHAGIKHGFRGKVAGVC